MFELVHETMPFVRLFYFLIHWINDVVDTIAMNIPFCHVYAISDPGNSRYTGVLPLFKGRALHRTRSQEVDILTWLRYAIDTGII